MTIGLSLLAHDGMAQIDGWSKGKGNMDVVASLSWNQGLGYYLAGGNTAAIQRYRASVGLFAARGLTRDLDLQVSIPFVMSNTEGGLQDAQAFLKWLPLHAHIGEGILSGGAAMGYSLPMSDYATEGLGAIGQQATSVIPMGAVQYRWNTGLFTSLVGGLTLRDDPVPSNTHFTFRLGKATADNYWEAYFQWQQADGGKDYRGTGDRAPSTFRELGVDFTRLGGKWFFPMSDRVGLVADVNYTLTGRNIDQAVMVAGSIVWRFPRGE